MILILKKFVLISTLIDINFILKIELHILLEFKIFEIFNNLLC